MEDLTGKYVWSTELDGDFGALFYDSEQDVRENKEYTDEELILDGYKGYYIGKVTKCFDYKAYAAELEDKIINHLYNFDFQVQAREGFRDKLAKLIEDEIIFAALDIEVVKHVLLAEGDVDYVANTEQ